MPKAESTLCHLTHDIPDPRNYYHSLPLAWSGLPREIILFTRRQTLLFPHIDIHHRFGLILALKGRGGVIVDEQLHQLGPGQGLLVFPFQQHYYTRLRSDDIVWLFICFEFDEAETLTSLQNQVFRLTNVERGFATKIVLAYYKSLKKDSMAIQSVSLWLSLLLLNLKHSVNRPIALTWSMTRLQQIIQKIIWFIAKNQDRSLRLEEIARASGISESHLQRIFHQILGVSLGRFVRCMRMNRSCALLHSSDQNITEIASTCGFSSVFAFSRAFRTEIGLSPLKYRQQFRRR